MNKVGWLFGGSFELDTVWDVCSKNTCFASIASQIIHNFVFWVTFGLGLKNLFHIYLVKPEHLGCKFLMIFFYKLILKKKLISLGLMN